MAADFGSISISSLTVTNSFSIPVTCPSGTQTGDLLLLVGQNEAAHTYNTPSGFAAIALPNDGGSTCVGSGVYYKFATSSDVAGSTSYTMTQNASGSTSQVNVAACVRYTGIDANQFPLAWNYTSNNPSQRAGLSHQTASTTTAANSACPAPTNPTVIGASDRALRIYMSGNFNTGTGKTMSATPSGWTERGRYITNNSGKYNQAMIVLDRLGATDTATMSSNGQAQWDTYTIALPALAIPTNQFMPFFGM